MTSMAMPPAGVPSGRRAANGKADATPRNSLQPRKRGDLWNADHLGLAAAAFDSVLNALRASQHAQSVSVGGKASPREMFEPCVGDAHRQRQLAMKAEDREAAIDGANGQNQAIPPSSPKAV